MCACVFIIGRVCGVRAGRFFPAHNKSEVCGLQAVSEVHSAIRIRKKEGERPVECFRATHSVLASITQQPCHRHPTM